MKYARGARASVYIRIQDVWVKVSHMDAPNTWTHTL